MTQEMKGRGVRGNAGSRFFEGEARRCHVSYGSVCRDHDDWGAAVITDHVYLVDQRDTLKSASSWAAIAVTLGMKNILRENPGIRDADLQAALQPIARSYILGNLLHLSQSRYDRAVETLAVDIQADRERGTVDVSVQADLGGFLFGGTLPFLSEVKEIEAIKTQSGVESSTNPVEVVLAIDISQSMECNLEGRRAGSGDESRIDIVKRAAANLVGILNPNEDNKVAVGVVPWHMLVRLDEDARADWKARGWAEYPKSRHYAVPYWCTPIDRCTPSGVDQNIPPRPPTHCNTTRARIRSPRAGLRPTSRNR